MAKIIEEEMLIAREVLEDDIYNLRRSAYYLVKVAHTLNIPYTLVPFIRKDQVTFNKINQKYSIIITDSTGVTVKLVQGIEYKDLQPLFLLQNRKKRPYYAFHIMLITYLLQQNDIHYDVKLKRIVGFKKGSQKGQLFEVYC